MKPLITSIPARILCDCGHSEEKRRVKPIHGTKKTSCVLCYEEAERREFRKYNAMIPGGLNGND